MAIGESQNLQLSGEVHTLCDLRLTWAAKGKRTPYDELIPWGLTVFGAVPAAQVCSFPQDVIASDKM